MAKDSLEEEGSDCQMAALGSAERMLLCISPSHTIQLSPKKLEGAGVSWGQSRRPLKLTAPPCCFNLQVFCKLMKHISKALGKQPVEFSLACVSVGEERGTEGGRPKAAELCCQEEAQQFLGLM